MIWWLVNNELHSRTWSSYYMWYYLNISMETFQREPVRTASLWPDIQTEYILKNKQECQPLKHDVQLLYDWVTNKVKYVYVCVYIYTAWF
jgi:hypothetical protein